MPPAANLNAARNLPGTTYHATPQLSFTFLRPNWKLAPFDDVRVRQAFWLAIDRQRIAQEAYHNAVIPSIHLVPEGMTGYNDSLIDGVGRTGKDTLTPDLATARALASAYAAEKCGGDFAACTPIALCFAGRENLARAVEIVIEEWASAFPGWRIYTTDACYRLQIFSPKTWQLTIGSWGAEYPDPQDFLSLLWSTQGELNRSYVNVAAADALCAQGDALGDQVARTQLYQQAEQLLVQQAAAIPLVQNTALYVVRSHVVNWRIASMGVTPLSVWQTTYIKR
jgi:oligopeptide transport system substrate-binding protein